MQILPHSITTGDEDVDATLRGHDLISVDLNRILMFILEHIHNVVSEEIDDREATSHDQMVCYK